jgi:choline-sulfatase
MADRYRTSVIARSLIHSIAPFAVAGVAIGVAEGIVCGLWSGAHSLDRAGFVAVVTLAIALHGLAACALSPLGGMCPAARKAIELVRSGCQARPAFRAGLLAGCLVAAAVTAPRLRELEWGAVEWRFLGYAVGLIVLSCVWRLQGLGANARLVKSATAVVALIALVVSTTGWASAGQAHSDALLRVAELSRSGNAVLSTLRMLFDADGDGRPTYFCSEDCDCDDSDSARPDSVPCGPAASPTEDAGTSEALAAVAVELDPDDVASDIPGTGCEPPLDPSVFEFADVDLEPDIVAMAPPRPIELLADRPSIVIIVVDTLRADHLGTYGYKQPTSPRIDAWAEGGTVFEQARSTGSQTRFSVPSIVTGKYFTEIRRTAGEWPRVLDEEETMAERLQASGYQTIGVVAIGYMQAMYGFGQGFDVYDESCMAARHPHRLRPTSDYVTDRMLAHLDSGQIDPGRPLFLWAYYGDPHAPYIHHKGEPTFGPAMKDVYDNEIAFTDRHIGRLLDGLEARGVLDSAVVFLTADHGEGLDESEDHGQRYHGPNLYDEVVRVPLIAVGPGIQKRRVATPVSLIDLLPTVLGLATTPPPEGAVRGQSLEPWLRGESDAPRPVFFEKHKDTALPQKGMVDWPYKVIWVVPYNRFRIFDLANDPLERRDLGRSADVVLREILIGRLTSWAHDEIEPVLPLSARSREAGSAESDREGSGELDL